MSYTYIVLGRKFSQQGEPRLVFATSHFLCAWFYAYWWTIRHPFSLVWRLRSPNAKGMRMLIAIARRRAVQGSKASTTKRG